jgi:hypothetical protein
MTDSIRSASGADPRALADTDHRGWFYRAVAPAPEARILEVGAPFVRKWFDDVTTGDLRPPVDSLAHGPSFAMVILHSTLGGCGSIAEALRSASGMLEPGGIVALAGVNRMRLPAPETAAAGPPSATAWGYRRAARSAGFADVALYAVRPNLDHAVDVVSLATASARAFFRHEALARKASGRDRYGAARSVLATLGLAPYLQPFFIMTARKC